MSDTIEGDSVLRVDFIVLVEEPGSKRCVPDKVRGNWNRSFPDNYFLTIFLDATS
jgi:hypothetical protein